MTLPLPSITWWSNSRKFAACKVQTEKWNAVYSRALLRLPSSLSDMQVIRCVVDVMRSIHLCNSISRTVSIDDEVVLRFICCIRVVDRDEKERKNQRGSVTRRREEGNQHSFAELWRAQQQWLNVRQPQPPHPRKNRKKPEIGISFASNTLFSSVVFNIRRCFCSSNKHFPTFFFRFLVPSFVVFFIQSCVCVQCILQSVMPVGIRFDGRVCVCCTCSHVSHEIRQCFDSFFLYIPTETHTSSTFHSDRDHLMCCEIREGDVYIHFLCLHRSSNIHSA